MLEENDDSARREEAIRLVVHKLDKLQSHTESSQRILRDLKTLRKIAAAIDHNAAHRGLDEMAKLEGQVDWQTCTSHPECIGIAIPDRSGRCLAHLEESELRQELTSLSLERALDVRGIRLNTHLIQAITDALLKWEKENPPRLRKAQFERTVFESGITFRQAIFDSDVSFKGATFEAYANFHAVRFEGDASFSDAVFNGPAAFSAAAFRGEAHFGSTIFKNSVSFDGSTIDSFAVFGGTKFEGDASFHESTFKNLAIFSPNVIFRSHATFGGHYGSIHYDEYGKRLDKGANFEDDANFSGAVFEGWAGFDGVRWKGTANFFLSRFKADVSVKDVVVEGSLLSFYRASFEQAQSLWSVSSSERVVLDSTSFTQTFKLNVCTKALTCGDANFLGGTVLHVSGAGVTLEDCHFEKPSLLIGLKEESCSKARPQLLSLQRTDVGNLAVIDVDLRCCHFQGAHRLDKLRIEGCNLFAISPRGWTLKRPWPPRWRWTRRQVIAEECEWRYFRQKRLEWRILPEIERARDGTTLDSGQIANIYRALRKGREDNRDVAGAADFYYGEMEMRRQAGSSDSSSGERAVLFLYWLSSGYGTRVLRPLSLLIATIISSAALLYVCGFVRPIPFSRALIYASAYAVGLSDANKLDLSAAGEAFQIGLRLLGPLFLGLILLSIKGRITR